MRVIAGRLRGATIRTPGTDAVRPTYDRVRESLFSIIEPNIEGAAVLDLFAGSGSLGIECLSRGAASATFVERDRSVLAVVRKNLEALDLRELSRAIRGDAIRLLGRGLPGAPYDIVFVDPPYASGLAVEALRLLGEGELLSDGALVVVEYETGRPPPESTGRLSLVRTKTYGTTEVGFYEVPANGRDREDQA
jgi:16S rRNA (guanine(966)-N(2))-methyltransferase RsmD